MQKAKEDVFRSYTNSLAAHKCNDAIAVHVSIAPSFNRMFKKVLFVVSGQSYKKGSFFSIIETPPAIFKHKANNLQDDDEVNLCQISCLTVNKDDQNLLLKRGAIDRTNNAIDRAQAKVERANEKVTGVGHVLSDHLGMKSLRKDLKAVLHPEQNAGNHHQKRDLNDRIDHAQAKVTGIHDRVQNVEGVVKDHAKNNGLVRDLSAAWHPEHQKRSEILFVKREENPKINRNWGYGNPHHKRESISIDQVLGRSQSHRSHQLIKRDLVDSANRAIDQAQNDITDKRNKVHAVKEVVDKHFKDEPLVNDVKQAWDSGSANV